MCSSHLKTLTKNLEKFDWEPKEIQGKRITPWFKAGEDIFQELFNLGLSVEWKYPEIKNHSEVNDIIAIVTKNKDWIESFISLYPSFRINFDLVGSADDVCKVRSGIDVLLKGFNNINSKFDTVLRDLNEQGEVDEFDRCLKLWIETGHRPVFKGKPSGLQQSHWWWF